MRETALTQDGQFDLRTKAWWSQAAELKVGEQFIVGAEGDAAGRMLVRRERLRNRNKEVEAIVWVIDDDGDGSLQAGGDRHSDCYVVDYGGDGVVDRMVDYIDNNGDKIPDEMDIRYFVDGELRQVWCGLDLDGDGAMWDLAGYEYSGDFFKSDPYGDNMIYMNKFNPEDGTWVPISECPFAFYDTDGDGQSEVTIRISAVPLAYDAATDPDYANDAARYRGVWGPEHRRMGVVNVRYSFDVDNLSSDAMPLHYDFGFNLVGATPYEYPGMEHFSPKRRPPQVTVVIPHKTLRAMCDAYPARETGFTWHEQHDDTISIGDAPDPALDFRWEGVFWIWERRFMENTGGPNQKWNVRREWSQRPADRRELYYSGVDRRIHLVGAEEGWIEIGHFNGLGALGELRMFDTDGNGYFDRWEVYRDGGARPARVTTVRDEKVRPLAWDYEAVSQFYMETVLPEAMAANAKLLAAMAGVVAFEAPGPLQQATEIGSLNNRRFAQDVLREWHYFVLREQLMAKANKVLRAAPMNEFRKLTPEQRRTTACTETAWQMVRLLERLDVVYGQGNFDEACAVLSELKPLRELFQ
ncbi:MAG: hypothetical protein JXA69_20940 [Phycisphaerae bacterium]|nr:hypothetical protein [Phycisphaerae bacterium]